jgi:hypothetical protein
MNRMAALVMAGLLVPGASEARMYQWVNADNGRVQMSGKPPAWYRAGGQGPRVLVYENGKLVDDTQRALSAEASQALRERATEDAAARRRALLEQDSAPAARSALDAGTTAKGGDDAAAVARLKAIIADWEQRQTASAKNVIEAQAGTAAEPLPVPVEPVDPAESTGVEDLQ